ncbi:MAG: hypothetical protein HZB30_10550 [Nitrospirae bacterium]|nr:hypothetical protein [Nitrospirota bacterium]
MNNILLLYDTQEEDLARDFKDMLEEFDIKIKMIPLLPDAEKTLQDKEDRYFKSADGAIFLITPGSERMRKFYPSPSLSAEMAMAKAKFENSPEKVIYLVDNNCSLPAIDQKPYILFERNNIRSIVKAITLFIKDLKHAGWFGKKNIEQKDIPMKDIAKYSESLDEKLKKICLDLSDKKNGFITYIDLDNLLQTKYRMRQRDINLTIRSLRKKVLITHLQTYGGCQLSDIGFELVTYEMEIEKKKRASNPFKGLLSNAPALSELPALSTNYAISPNNKAVGLLSPGLRRKNEK